MKKLGGFEFFLRLQRGEARRRRRAVHLVLHGARHAAGARVGPDAAVAPVVRQGRGPGGHGGGVRPRPDLTASPRS